MPNQFTKQNTDHRDKDVLRTLYWDEQLTMAEIADRLGVCRNTIYNWMEKHDIERRDPQQQRFRFYKPPAFVTTSNGYRAWQTQWEGERRQVLVHRLLAVSEYGFDAVKDNQIHHKNGVKWDNRPENIEVLSPSEHQKRHPEISRAGGKAQQYSDSELLEYIKLWHINNGEMPSSDTFKSLDNVPSVRTYMDRFGGWVDAKEKAKKSLENAQ
jgi:transposase-like protein